MGWRRWRGCGCGLVLALLLAFAGGLLERDPTPRFLARRSRLVAVEAQASTRAGGSLVERLRLRAASGLTVELAVKRRLDAGQPLRRPLVVLLGGFETGRDAVDLVADPRGVILAALSYPYPGPPPAHGPRGILALPALRAGVLDTPPAVLLALDHLLARPEVDPGRVELVGVSLGAPFALVAGALDRRVRRVWSVHGAGDLPLLIDTALDRVIPFSPLRRAVAELGYLAAGGPAVAPERWAGRIAPRPLVMLNALADERMPRRAILALYARARPPKELVWLPGPHVEPDRREVVERLIDQVLGRIVSPLTPGPSPGGMGGSMGRGGRGVRAKSRHHATPPGTSRRRSGRRPRASGNAPESREIAAIQRDGSRRRDNRTQLDKFAANRQRGRPSDPAARTKYGALPQSAETSRQRSEIRGKSWKSAAIFCGEISTSTHVAAKRSDFAANGDTSRRRRERCRKLPRN